MHTRSNPLKPTSWLPWAAWAAFAVTVPAAVWRVLMIFGLMPGTADLRRYEIAGDPASAYTYVGMLSLVQLVAGYAAVGLVRPWGENVLGRRVPLAPVVTVATLGGLTVTWIFDVWMVSALLAGQRPDAGLTSGGALVVMVCCYAPLLLWGPLELVATWGYWRRRRQTTSTITAPTAHLAAEAALDRGGAGSFGPTCG